MYLMQDRFFVSGIKFLMPFSHLLKDTGTTAFNCPLPHLILWPNATNTAIVTGNTSITTTTNNDNNNFVTLWLCGSKGTNVLNCGQTIIEYVIGLW